MKKLILSLCLIIAAFSPIFSQVGSPSPVATTTPAASPSPSDAQQEAVLSFAETLKSFTNEAIAARALFIEKVEKPLSGWFYQLAQLLAVIMFAWAFVDGIMNSGGFTPEDLFRITARAAIGFLLFGFAGDINGDGIRGDLVNYPASVGYYYAYGVSSNGQVDGSFLNKTVTTYEDEFNERYKKFSENKFMVKVSGQDIPVKYPTTKDLNLLAALYTGKPISQQEIEQAKSREWQMSMLYGTFNFSRGVLAFADFFLFFISGFAVVVIRLSLPFMIAAMFHKTYGQKITVGYFWTTFVWTIIFPGVCQFIRLMAFAGGGVAMGLGGDSPYYAWDATQGSIVAKGNPEAVIIIASLYMLFSSLCLFAAFFISMYFSQGKALEGIVSTTSAWWTAATSIGIGVGTGAAAAGLATKADRVSAKASQDGQMVEAGFAKEAALNSAEESNRATKISADSSYTGEITQSNYNKAADDLRTNAAFDRERVGAFAGLVDRVGNLRTENYQSKAQAMMNLKQDWMNLDSKERQERMTNALDFSVKNNDAYAREIQQAIKDYPEAKELIGKQVDNYMNGVPLAGSVLKTVGLNGDAVNSWLGSDAGKVFAGSMITQGSNPFVFNNVDSTDGLNGIFSEANISKALQTDMQNAETGGAVTPSFNQQTFAQPRQMSKLQKSNFGKLQKLLKRDPNFLPALQKMTQRNGWNPDDLLDLMALETANTFDPAIRGGGGNNYVGLIQFGEGARKDLSQKFGTPVSASGFQQHLKQVSPTQQLKYVESYLQQAERMSGTKLNSTAKLYGAIGAGSAAKNDATVIFRRGGYQSGDFKNTRRISSGGYKGNAPWDVNKDGVIQQWEFGAAAESRLGAGTHFSANETFGELRSVDIPTSKVVAAQKARQFQREHEVRQNALTYQSKENIATQFYGEQRQIAGEKFSDSNTIADNVAGMRQTYAETNYGYNMQMAGITRDSGHQEAALRQDGTQQRALINREGTYTSADINRDAAVKAAVLAYQGREQSSAINYEAALESSHLRAMSQMWSNIGSNAGHHIAEASEKFSRL